MGDSDLGRRSVRGLDRRPAGRRRADCGGGWRSIFLVNVPLGLVAIWLTLRYATETPALRQRRLDLAGQAAGVLSLACLAGAIIEGGKSG